MHKESNNNNNNNTYEGKYNIGNKIYYNAVVQNNLNNSNNTNDISNKDIILNIGCNVFLEVQFKEAITYTKDRIKILRSKHEKIQDKISYTRGNIAISKEILNEFL